MTETNKALAAAGLNVKADQKVRHMVEILIEDFGYDELGKHVKKPLDGTWAGNGVARGNLSRIALFSRIRSEISTRCLPRLVESHIMPVFCRQTVNGDDDIRQVPGTGEENGLHTGTSQGDDGRGHHAQ